MNVLISRQARRREKERGNEEGRDRTGLSLQYRIRISRRRAYPQKYLP